MNTLSSSSYVLLADDNVNDRYFLSEAFSKINATNSLKVVDSGKSMLEYLNSLSHTTQYPSLIVLENSMSTMSGEELLKALKQNEKFSHIPVIIYSSLISPSLKTKLTNLGAKYSYEKVTNFSGAVQFAKALKMYSEQWMTSISN